MSNIHDCYRNSSPMILIGNGIQLLRLGNNFTRHRLIRHTNDDDDDDDDDNDDNENNR